jgi:hypothetical protein
MPECMDVTDTCIDILTLRSLRAMDLERNRVHETVGTTTKEVQIEVDSHVETTS